MTIKRDIIKKSIIAAIVTGISLLHFAPMAGKFGTHLLHRELYFFPILLAAFWYGLKGGVFSAVIVSVVYAFQFAAAGILSDVMTAVGPQVMVFLAVGMFLGGMVDRQSRRRRERDLIHKRLAEERMHQREINIQIETAAKIQSLFRPKLPTMGHGSHVWADSRPAKFVGGDLYDVIPMPDKSWLVYVADVSDKGLPAALIMAALWYRIHNQAHLHDNVGQLLTSLNKPFYDLVSDEGYFVTIFIGRYWPENGRFEFANGGHPPALKMGPEGWEAVNGRRGMPLGVLDNSTYETETICIAPAQAILLMTDGITEAVDVKGTQCCLDHIYRCLKKEEGPPYGRNLIRRINDLGPDQGDDLTLLEVWRSSQAHHISHKARKETYTNTAANTPPPGM